VATQRAPTAAAAAAVRAERKATAAALVQHYGSTADGVHALLLARLAAVNPDGDVAAAAVHRLLAALHTFDYHMNALVTHSGVLQVSTMHTLRGAGGGESRPGCW
jgi:hypothetical protein